MNQSKRNMYNEFIQEYFGSVLEENEKLHKQHFKDQEKIRFKDEQHYRDQEEIRKNNDKLKKIENLLVEKGMEIPDFN